MSDQRSSVGYCPSRDELDYVVCYSRASMHTIEMWIISPAGKRLATIKVPERVSNVAWGDKDGKTLYITASTSLYRLRLKVPGVRN